MLFFLLSFLPTSFLICINKNNRRKYSTAVIVLINTNTSSSTRSSFSTTATKSSTTNSSIFLRPVFLRLYRIGSKLKRNLNYISSLEKQNVISYTNVKYVTPIKKRKKQFILLKSKDDEDISINICRLGKKKKQKREENHVNLLESKHTEYLYKDKNGGITKGKKNRNSRNNRSNNKNRSRKENKEMELEMNIKKKQDLLNYSSFNDCSSEKNKKENIENRGNDTKDKREITETCLLDDYDGDGNGDEDGNGNGNGNGDENEKDSESEISRKRKNTKSVINTSFSESSGGNYDDGDNGGTDEDENEEDKDEGEDEDEDEDEEEEEEEEEVEDEEEEEDEDEKEEEDEDEKEEEENEDTDTEKRANIRDSPKKENEEISVHETGEDEEKQKCIDEYNRLIQLISESENKRLARMKENEKKEEYEFREKVINSSRKWNMEHLKKEIERNFKPNEALEKKIQGYMPMFTQDVKNETEIEDTTKDTTNTYTTTSDTNPEGDDTANNSSDLITDEEEKENIKILKKMNAGDYSDLDKFHLKFSKKDLERMQKFGQGDSEEETTEKDDNLNKQEEEEEKKLMDELFLKIQSDKHNVLGKLRQKEQEVLELYKQKEKRNEIERNEELENLIYYNKKNEQEMERRNRENRFNETVPVNDTSHVDKKEKTTDGETDINPNMFFSNDEKFVYIEEEEIRNMSEAQIRDELRKRNYPTFGSVDVIRDRLLQVMKIKKNCKLDIREIIRNPEEHTLSNIQLNKLRETVKTYKEASACGDMDSKLKQIDAALEISDFLKDPAHYLRIDSFQKMGQTENNTNALFNEKKNQNEDISKAPILNDYNFDKEVTMAENLKKTFNLDNEERQPDRIKRVGSDENNSYDDEELDEEKEELRRREILKHGSLQETILEFHYKHDLSLDFIGDFICKFTDVNIEEINTYKLLSEKEMQNYSMSDLEKILNFTSSTYSSAYPYAAPSSTSSSARAYSSASYSSPYVSFEDEGSLNKNVFVPKFVDVNELIGKYLSTKHIVMLIEYSNIADPVDIDQYYVPENLYMLSEEYGLPIQDVIDACTHLSIKLPFGGDTHLNKECFNALTVYIKKHKKVRKQK